MEVKTNNHHRDLLDAWSLTEEEREEFDYIDWEAIERGEASANFFRYKGELYDFGEFVESAPVPGWDAARSDTFFSGLVVRYCNDEHGGDSVVVGTYCA